MRRFFLILRAVNRMLSRMLLVNILVNTVIIFLGVFSVLFFLKFYPGLSVIPALVYLGVRAHTEFKRGKWGMVEEKYRPLSEKLRTAADNVNAENPIVYELQEDVTRELRNVRLSWFMDLNRFSYKILGIIVLCLIILMMARFDINWDPFESQGLRQFKFGAGGSGSGLYDSDIIAAGEQKDESIFGQSSVAKLGDEEIRIQINPAGNEINLRDAAEIEEREFEESFPDEVYAGSSDLYEENLPKEQLQLVKKYFENLAGSNT